MPRTHSRADAAPATVTTAAARLGANIVGARLRRGWTQAEVAEKAGITRNTLSRVETGNVGTGLGAYVAVLWALGLHEPVTALADAEHDPEGVTLATARLGVRARGATSADDAF